MDGSESEMRPAAATIPLGAPLDWPREVRFDRLVAHPDVRPLLARAARTQSPNLTPEACLSVYEKLLAKVGSDVNTDALSAVVAPILARMGVRADRPRGEVIHAPAGQTLVAVLCSLASRGNTLNDVHQARDGCAFEAVLLSDVWCWEGSLFVAVAAEGERSRLEVRATSGGQFHDWAKSARRLDQLVGDVRAFATRTYAA